MDFATQLRDAERLIREQEASAFKAFKEGKGEAPVIYRAFGKAAQTKNPEIFVASEESEDRFGDIIQIAGWKLDTFEQNPAMLFGHDHSIPPIGISKKTWVEGKQLLFSPSWDMADPFAALIAGKYERGVMRAVSVGFRALEMENRSTAKGEPAYVFKAQELLEISAVAVPAHPAALKKAMGDTLGLAWLPMLYEKTAGERELRDMPVGLKAPMGKMRASLAAMQVAMDDMEGMMDQAPAKETDLSGVIAAIKEMRS